MKNIKLFAEYHEKLYIFAVMAVFFIIALVLNFHTDYVSDDFKYHFLYDTPHTPHEGTKRISSLFDVILSQINHWRLCNGRVVAHGLLQMVLPFGKTFFKIFNSLVYTGLGFLIYRHAAYNRRENPVLLLFIYIMMWLFIPQYGMTVLWASGAANYLWCAAIILAYLLPYRMYASGRGVPEDNLRNLILTSVFGMFAGCTSENTGGGLVLMCILFVIFYRIKGLKIPRWSWAGILSSAAGAAVLICAPSSGGKLSGELTFKIITDRLESILKLNAELTYGLTVIIAVLVFICFIRGNMPADRKDGLIPAVYLIGACATVAALVLSPQHPERSWFTAVILMIVVAGMFCSEILDGVKRLTSPSVIIVTAAVCVVFAVSFSIGFRDINTTYKVVSEGVDRIEQALSEGRSEVTIPIVTPTDSKYDPFNGAGYVKASPGDWLNAWMAEYYGIDRIRGE